MKNNKFRVLIVDDKQTVLDATKDLNGNKIEICGTKYIIDLIRLKVEIVGTQNDYRISESTLDLLNQYCKFSFDLILIDFGYTKQGQNTVEEFIKLQKENQDLSNKDHLSNKELLDKIVLNPSHIVEAISSNKEKLKNSVKNFINHENNVHVYTYIPNIFEKIYTNVEVRKNITNQVFSKAPKINIIDSREELFNDVQFEKIHEREKEYYPFLITKFLSKIIQIEISEYLLKSNLHIKYKFEKIRKSNREISSSIIIPSIIAGIFIPLFLNSIEDGNYFIAGSLLLSLIIIIAFSIVVPRIIEKRQKEWLK